MQPAGVVLLDHEGVRRRRPTAAPPRRRARACAPGPASRGTGEPVLASVRRPSAGCSTVERVRRRASRRSSTSSDVELRQVRGRRAPPRCAAPPPSGASGPRSEYGTMVVFAPLFWLQSTSTLPRAQRLLHVADHEVRVVGLQRAGQFVRHGRDLVASSASRRGRRRGGCPCCRWSPASGPAPCPSRIVAGQPRDLRALGQPAPSPGSRSSTSRSGLRRLRRPARTATAARGSRARPSARARSGWRGRSTSGYTLRGRLCGIVAPRDPVGRAGVEVLLEEHRARAAPRCPPRGPSACGWPAGRAACGISTSATAA